MSRAFSSSVDGADFESFAHPEDDVLAGQPNPRVHWLRPEGHGSQAAGVFRCDPAVFRYAWEGDETIHVLEGSVRIEVEGGEALDLGVGDLASFNAGDRGVWRVLEPFCEFFVLSV